MHFSLKVASMATMAVVGSASASIVDPFTTSAGTIGVNTPWVSIAGGLFAQRQATASNTASASLTGDGLWNFTVPSPLQTAQIKYRQNATSTQTLDFSGIASMSIDLNVSRGPKYLLNIYDSTFKLMGFSSTLATSGASTLNFDLANPGYLDAGFDVTKVVRMDFIIQGVSSGAVSGTASNFTYTAVPAPGAIALLGLAGLAGRRRR
jgi:hypothetical protein